MKPALLVLAIAIFVSACGVEPPPAISVTIMPDWDQIYPFYSIQMRAWVRNATNENVIWSLSGSGRCGSLNETGLYTAPPSVPDPARVTITATSVEDPSKSASAEIDIVDGPRYPYQWAWVSGSDRVDSSGSYGTKGVSDPTNVPGARQAALSWNGPSGALWLFGGFGYSYDVGILNDLWKYDPAIDEWTWVSGGDHPDQRGVYGTKGTPDPANVPGSREWSCSWIDASGGLWLFGGEAYDADGDLGETNDLWRYDPVAATWTWISGSDQCWDSASYGTKGIPDPSNRPGARWGHVSWADPDGDLWFFGGKGPDQSPEQLYGDLNDLWRFDPDTLVWTWVAGTALINQPGTYGVKGTPHPSNVPGGRDLAARWTDADGNFWLFGGTGYDAAGNGAVLNDLWKFDRNLGQWTWISGSDLAEAYGTYGVIRTPAPSNVPGARAAALTWTDPSGKLWLFGGAGYASTGFLRVLNDLWQFDPLTLEWTWFSGSDQPEPRGVYVEKHIVEWPDNPGARYHAVSWLGPHGDLWLFGGWGYDAQQSGHLNDLWRYHR